MMTFAIFGVLIFLIMVGLPIAVSMGLTAVIFFVVLGEIDVLCMIPARMYSSTTGFPLLAIPFFILVGNLMNTGGMTNRIFRFAQCLVGHIKGGLGHVNVVNSMIFAGMSGAAVADAAGIGMVEMEAMTKAGFDRRFSAAVTAASSTIGPVIPPERLLKKIRIARAFTCYQMANLIGEKLVSLLNTKTVRAIHESPLQQKPWVILLGPITTFLDEDVPEREVRPLFERALGMVEKMAMRGIPFFIFQPTVFPENPPNPPLIKGGKGGLMDSRRAYLARRLFRFSNLVWRIHLEDEGPKMVLEKKIADSRWLMADRKNQITNTQ